MKVRLIKDCEGPNPEFDPAERPSKKNPHTIPRPKGTEIEHPDAHYLCAFGLAEPLDEEAREAHGEYLERKAKATAGHSKARAEQLAALRKANAEAEQRNAAPQA